MSDQLKIQEAVTFVQQTPPESYRLLDITIVDIPAAYKHGKVVAAAAVIDQKITEDTNIFTMSCAVGITLKVGGTTSPSMTNLTYFSYKGAKTSFWISNPGTEDVPIDYVAGSL